MAEFDARHRSGESWRDLALVVDRRLAGYLDRMQRGSLTEGAARTFAWHDLRQVGVGDDLALKTVNELIEAVQRGEKPFDDRYPVVDRETIQQTVKRWRAHHTT